MWKKLWNPSNRKVFCCNCITAAALCLFLEYTERRSFAAVIQFINARTFIFLYNVLILFVCLSLVFIAKKKLFTYAAITGGWLMVGAANGVVLGDRKTPFSAVDLSLAKSILPVLRSYYELWQIVLMVIGVIVGVIVLVSLYLYSPVAKKSFDFKANMIMVLCLFLAFSCITYVNAGRKALIRKFDNLIAGYEDYGVAYGFCVTALDTGIDRPIDYSKKRIAKLKKTIQKKLKSQDGEAVDQAERRPNIIFIQLESFFDLTTVKDLRVSEDPIPTIRKLQEDYISGQLKVPVYGAGTINTEFEVITGMSTDFFGAGEYPYRSVLQSRVCDGIFFWLKEHGYEGTVIHNNNAAFYDRNVVFANFGVDHFITSENMNLNRYNEAGWPKDSILTEQITDTLKTTGQTDLIYTISVQAHGDYPATDHSLLPIQVSGEGFSEKYLNQLTYYANQIREMDDFISHLLEELSDYPEDTMVIAYGDHLPGMDFDSEELTNGSKYQTPYFIWDNFGYSRSHREEKEDLPAYRLASKVLAMLNVDNGVLNQFHQAMKNTKNYRKNLKLLQYDMIYGSDFISDGLEEEKASKLQFGLRPIRIKKIRASGKHYLLFGKNFTSASRIYVNGILADTKWISPTMLRLSGHQLKEEDEIVIHQVSQTNENITLNQSEPFLFYGE